MGKHKRKKDPETFHNILTGDRTFDLRPASSMIQVGDIITYQECDYDLGEDGACKGATGKSVEAEVIFIDPACLSTRENYKYQMMSIRVKPYTFKKEGE